MRRRDQLPIVVRRRHPAALRAAVHDCDNGLARHHLILAPPWTSGSIFGNGRRSRRAGLARRSLLRRGTLEFVPPYDAPAASGENSTPARSRRTRQSGEFLPSGQSRRAPRNGPLMDCLLRARFVAWRGDEERRRSDSDAALSMPWWRARLRPAHAFSAARGVSAGRGGSGRQLRLHRRRNHRRSERGVRILRSREASAVWAARPCRCCGRLWIAPAPRRGSGVVLSRRGARLEVPPARYVAIAGVKLTRLVEFDRGTFRDGQLFEDAMMGGNTAPRRQTW